MSKTNWKYLNRALFKKLPHPERYKSPETINFDLKCMHLRASQVTGIPQIPPFKFTYLSNGVWGVTT